MDLADVAARVAFAIQAVQERARDLSLAYGIQLRGSLHRDPGGRYLRFDDLNSRRVVLAVHSLFYELAILRDVVSEFLARFVFAFPSGEPQLPRTMRGLCRRLRREAVDHPLAFEIAHATDSTSQPPGWLAVLSAYRNLFTHVAPLEQVAGHSFAVRHPLVLADGRELQILYHALPGNPIEVERTRGERFPYANFDEWATASAAHVPARETQPDALEKLHDYVNQLVQLCGKVADHSPVRGEMVHLSDSDMVGPVTMRRA